MEAFIASAGAYVPDCVITNDELAARLETSDEWIYSHTGIHERRIATEDETASSMAIRAAETALARADLPAADVDMILVATSTPDFVGFPSTASIVQHAIGASKAGAMDLFAACTGFIYGLETARNFIVAGSATNILVIGSEKFSSILDWEDRNTCVLFGDGAGAVLVSAAPSGSKSRVAAGTLYSKGDGAAYLYVDSVVHMDGRRVYNFAVKALCDTIDELLEREGRNREHIDAIVPHQANIRIIGAAARRLGLSDELFYTNMDRYANTSAASIPIALNEMHERELLHRGDLLLTIGFGGGLTYGGNLVYW